MFSVLRPSPIDYQQLCGLCGGLESSSCVIPHLFLHPSACWRGLKPKSYQLQSSFSIPSHTFLNTWTIWISQEDMCGVTVSWNDATMMSLYYVIVAILLLLNTHPHLGVHSVQFWWHFNRALVMFNCWAWTCPVISIYIYTWMQTYIKQEKQHICWENESLLRRSCRKRCFNLYAG